MTRKKTKLDALPCTAESIHGLIAQLARKEPLVGVGLHEGRVTVTSDSKVCKTACVSMVRDRVTYVFNTDFMQQLDNDKQRIAVIKHEALHLLFGHLAPIDLGVPHALLNICMDAVINQFIQHLPAGAIAPENLAAVALGTVVTQAKPQKKPPDEFKEVVGQLRDAGLTWTHSTEWPECLTPKVGLSLRALVQYLRILTGDQLDKLAATITASGVTTLDEHPAAGCSDIWGELIREKLHEELRSELGKGQGIGRGSGFDHLRKALSDLVEPKKDWKEELRAVLDRASAVYDFDASWKRLNRRFGVYAAGESSPPKLRIGAIVDTSGSVSPRILGAIEAHLKSLGDSGVIVPEFEVVFGDTQVCGEGMFNGRFPADRVRGGGGTDMQPMIAYIREKYSPDIVVICTDGFVPVYSLPGPTDDLVWLHTYGYNLEPTMPGTRIKVKVEDGV